MATKKISKNISKKISKKTNKYSRLSKKLNVKKRLTKLKGGAPNWLKRLLRMRSANITQAPAEPETATDGSPMPTVFPNAWTNKIVPPQPPRLKKKGVKTIKHFWNRDWPDNSTPNYGTNINFVDDLCDDINKNGGGTVIHCSAGIGRTGTLFVILKLIYDYKKNNPKIKVKNLSDLLKTIKDRSYVVTYEDIKNAIIYARLRRMRMVQTYIQYTYLCELFGITETTDVNFIKNEEELKNIHTTELAKYDSTNYFKQDKNLTKNRYNDILPYSHNMVIVNSIGVNASSIGVNASILNQALMFCTEPKPNYCKATDINGGVVIATQCPIIESQQDFFAMLSDDSLNIKRIVMLTGLVEKDKPKCADYTTSTGTGTGTGTETITLSNLGYNIEYGNKTNFDLVHNGLNYELTNGQPIEHSSPQVGSIVKNNQVPFLTIPPPPTISPEVERFIKFCKQLELNGRLSFCDCKMILLYMISYSNNFKQDTIYDLKSIILQKHKDSIQKQVSGNIKTIIAVYDIIEKYYTDFDRTKIIEFFTCRLDKTKMSNYLNSEKEAYTILFGVTKDSDFSKIVTNMECIFDGSGNVIEGLNFDTLGNPFDPHTNFSCDSSA